jgi:hypothetical protein
MTKKEYNEEAGKLIAYYQINLERIDYKKYQQTWCGIIGLGSIESAHRTVIQKKNETIRTAMEQRRRTAYA